MSEDKPTSWLGIAASAIASWSRWMQSQTFNNVVLVAILVALFAGAYYAMKEAIPAHITMIKEGYREVERSNREALKEMDQAHREERREMFNMFDRWLKTDKVAGR